MRRASGKPSLDEELRTGHVPHKGFEPPQGADYVPFIAQTQFVSAPLKTGKHDFHNAEQMKKYEEERGIKVREARRNRREKQRAAAQKQQQRQESRAGRQDEEEEEEEEKDARRREKGKERAYSVSRHSMTSNTRSAVTAPERVVTRDSRRQSRG